MYCDFYSIAGQNNRIPKFIESICHEIELSHKLFEHNWKFDSLFFGGGTPSLLDPKHFETIFNSLSKFVSFSELKEISIEANPGEISLTKLIEFRKLGINRLSIGFQSLDKHLLTFLSRHHSPSDCIDAFHYGRKAGFDNISIDMIFDIPGQTLELWEKHLHQIIELNPQHVSAYSLTVEKETLLYRLVQKEKVKLPSETLDIAMFTTTRKILNNAGYLPYETSNFAKPNFECKHNNHYWKMNPYISFGPSSHSYDGQNRWWNYRSLVDYTQKLSQNELPIDGQEHISDSMHFNEYVLNGLRLASGVNLNELSTFITEDIHQYLSPYLAKWESHLIMENNYLKLTDSGILLTDEITSDLFLDD